MFLLDTNVVSELRKPHADSNVLAWARTTSARDLFISAVTLLELETGVLRLERKDKRQGGTLRRWLDGHVIPAFAGRVLPVDSAVALRCARFQVPDRMALGDALIAATALAHALVVVTRNTTDFEPADVELINPWQPDS